MNAQSVTVGARLGRKLNAVIIAAAQPAPDRVAFCGGVLASIAGAIGGLVGPQTAAELLRIALARLEGQPQLELPPGVRLAIASAENDSIPEVHNQREEHMKTAFSEGILPVPGTPFGGGIFVDVYMQGAERRALILAPKAEGELRDVRWHTSYADVAGAKCYVDGLTNTRAMADAGSELAQKMLALRIGGKDDWCLPALDQLERAYFRLKPTTRKNYCWMRSGINLSAIPAQWPYAEELPAQTSIEAFRAGGIEAFEPGWYWTSTQHRAGSDYACVQYFDDGDQDSFNEASRYLARAVRSESI